MTGGTDQSCMLRLTLALYVQLLEPLRLACGQTLPRLVEPALACLHKLVSQDTTFAKSKALTVCRQFSACRSLMHTCKLKAPLAGERATILLLLR